MPCWSPPTCSPRWRRPSTTWSSSPTGGWSSRPPWPTSPIRPAPAPACASAPRRWPGSGPSSTPSRCTTARRPTTVLTIDGATPEWFGPLAAQHQIVLYELVHDRGSLEEVFLSLTHGFDAVDPGPWGRAGLPGAPGRERPGRGRARGARGTGHPCPEARHDRRHPLGVVEAAHHRGAVGAGRHRRRHHRAAHPPDLPQRGRRRRRDGGRLSHGLPPFPTPPSSFATWSGPDSAATCSPSCSAP